MTGAMAGTATFHFRHRANGLRVVTLTVNNICNLRCPHCYLQYKGDDGFASREVLDPVIAAPYEHLAIVGKEPLVNRAHAEACAQLIVRANESGKSVSLITNGLNLHLLPEYALRALSWIDVSLDGGPKTYGTYRGPLFERLLRELRQTRNTCAVPINALHTLSSQNASNVDDMVASEELFAFEKIVFSLFVSTRTQGRTSVDTIAVPSALELLSRSVPFRESERTRILLGAHLLSDRRDGSLRDLLERTNLSPKTLLIEDDPLDLGILRVTYDGLVLTPLESLHTDDYRRAALMHGCRILESSSIGLTPVGKDLVGEIMGRNEKEFDRLARDNVRVSEWANSAVQEHLRKVQVRSVNSDPWYVRV